MLLKASIPSGAFVLDGFKDDDKFVASEAVPNYVAWEFRGHEENTINQSSCINTTGSDVELVSILGGIYLGGGGQVQLTSLGVLYQPQDIPTVYPNNYIFYSLFGSPSLPYSFSRGLLVPNGARIQMTFNNNLAYLRLVGLLRLPKMIGNIVGYP